MSPKNESNTKLLKPWLTTVATDRRPSTGKKTAFIYLFSGTALSAKKTIWPGDLGKQLSDWQKEQVLRQQTPISLLEGKSGPLVLLCPFLTGTTQKMHPLLTASAFAKTRDLYGQALTALDKYAPQKLSVQLPDDDDLILAAVTGLEISHYRFKGSTSGIDGIYLHNANGALKRRTLEQQAALGWCVNVARHLVNLPPNELYPESYAKIIQNLFKGLSSVKIDVWKDEKLVREKMRLLMAVGQGSENKPCLVHLSYRPAKPVGKKRYALVGKGITFDSGGLDLKPASGMRLMKKDMGGSAAVLGTLLWAAHTQLPVALDGYVALAENSVGQSAFRPSDVYESRSGKTVEIHNTDAEGRLVLADALDVAVTQKNAPDAVINVATLTGAIKVGLGSQIAGLFSNDQDLAHGIEAASQSSGDLCWQMPLFQKYRSGLNSGVADMANATDGYGGAITAALFLESFVRETPWAHLDIYAWKDGPDGAHAEGGGSGQAVQSLSFFLKGL